MKMQMPVALLKPALQGLGKVISHRSNLPVLGHLLFRARDHRATVTATNLDDTVIHEFGAAAVFEPFEALAPYELLARIVRDCPKQDSVTLEVGPDKSTISFPVGCNTISQSFPTLPAADFPLLPGGEPDREAVAGPDFKEALLQALECASTDTSRQVLQNAFVDVSDPEAHYVVATDGRHLFSANSFRIGLPESVLVPQRKFITWSGFLEDGDWRIGLVKTKEVAHLRLRSERWTFITRQPEGPYPNWRQVVPLEAGRTTVRLDAEAMAILGEALKRLPVGSSRVIRLSGSPGSPLLVQNTDPEQRATVPITGAVIEGEEAGIALSRDYLLRALAFGLDQWTLRDALTPILCQKGGRRMLIMPMSMSGTPAPAPQAEPKPQPNQNQNPNPNPPEPAAAFKAAAPPETKTKESNMSTATNHETTTPPRPETRGSPSAMEALGLKIESARAALRNAAGELGEALAAIKAAEREKRAGEKELQNVRATLRSLQKVQI